eukprot:9469182-Pyramimonas_sp.AAC.1
MGQTRGACKCFHQPTNERVGSLHVSEDVDWGFRIGLVRFVPSGFECVLECEEGVRRVHLLGNVTLFEVVLAVPHALLLGGSAPAPSCSGSPLGIPGATCSGRSA